VIEDRTTPYSQLVVRVEWLLLVILVRAVPPEPGLSYIFDVIGFTTACTSESFSSSSSAVAVVASASIQSVVSSRGRGASFYLHH